MASITHEDVRIAARIDPSIFASLIIGRGPLPQLHRDLHGHRLRYPDCAIELPRGHGKTAEIAIGEIHAIAKATVEHPDWPIPRLKVVTSNDDEADKTARFLLSIAEAPATQWVFPELVPDPDQWNLRAWRWRNVNATGRFVARDATCETKSIMGRAGGRWDRLWFDDICDLQNSIIKPALRPQVEQAVKSVWMPMRDRSSPHPRFVVRSFTPWHLDDQGVKWRNAHAKDGSLFRRPCINFVSPWPEVFTEEALRFERYDEKGIGAIAYARAYELVPASSDQLVFRPEWMTSRMWTEMDPNTRALSESWLALDFAFTDKTATKPDPDRSVCHFARIDRNRRVWLMETLSMRADFPTFARAVKEGAKRHGTRRGVGEAVAGQIGLVQQLARDLQIPMEPLTRTKDKFYRATEGQSQVERGDLLLRQGSDPGSPSADQLLTFEEMCGFPAAGHDDHVDPLMDLLAVARTVTPRVGGEPGVVLVPTPVPAWSMNGTSSRLPSLGSLR